MRFCHAYALAAAILVGAFVSPAHAQPRVSISIDTSLADQALGILCTGRQIDEAAVRASPLVQAQVSHNSGLRDTATMDNYVAALRALSACQAPTPDAFGVADIIAHPDVYRGKIVALRARQQELADAVAARLERYLPPNADFSGDVVLAVPYFSCGGFSDDDRFFIDIRCLDQDINVDFPALVALSAHETYHAIQARYFFAPGSYDAIRTRNDGLTMVLSELLLEGSATYVGSSEALPATGGGMLTRINRDFARTNAQRMSSNFVLMSMLIEQMAQARDAHATAEEISRIAFSGGTFQEMGYHVGARMARDIETAWGAPALVCVMLLAPEQFVLAHDAVAEAGGAEFRLGPSAVNAARNLARSRRGATSFGTCPP